MAGTSNKSVPEMAIDVVGGAAVLKTGPHQSVQWSEFSYSSIYAPWSVTQYGCITKVYGRYTMIYIVDGILMGHYWDHYGIYCNPIEPVLVTLTLPKHLSVQIPQVPF